MTHICTVTGVILSLPVLPLSAQESKPGQSQDGRRQPAVAQSGHTWTKTLKDRAKRGTLADGRQHVRGDSGKWSLAPRLQHAPPIGLKPDKLPLDEWADQLLKKPLPVTSGQENWLLFRTRQLDDNDRLWVERIERRGNQFTVFANQARWTGKYRRNFTYHAVLGVNLGKLEPGKYQARWVVKPLVFSVFESPGTPRDNWPKDARPADPKPAGPPEPSSADTRRCPRVSFSVVPQAP